MDSKSWTAVPMRNDVYRHWCEVKDRLSLQDNNQFAALLLRHYDSYAEKESTNTTSCAKCGSPLSHLCTSCLQQHQFVDKEPRHSGENQFLLYDDKIKTEDSADGNYETASKALKIDDINEGESVNPQHTESCERSEPEENSHSEDQVELGVTFSLELNDKGTQMIKNIKRELNAKDKRLRKFCCKYCHKIFLTCQERTIHLKADHRVNSAFQNRVYHCVKCPQTFSSRKECRLHSKAVHKIQMAHLCDECGLVLTSSLNVHKRLHSQQKPHVCDVCHKAFTQSSTLGKHKLIHTDQRTHQCVTCGKMFRNRLAVQKHQVVHTKEKPFPCPSCDRAFGHRENLQRHLLIHTGQKPYVCDLCHKAFNQSSILQVHKKVHAEGCSGKGRGRPKRQKDGLPRERACPVCGKTFGDARNMYRHKLTHSGLRPYVCRECGKSFNNCSNLKTHEKIHQKPCNLHLHGAQKTFTSNFVLGQIFVEKSDAN